MIRFYNTFTQKKDLLFDNKINIYTCGITVYDHCHIGHARTFIFMDSIVRYLLRIDVNINFVRNITDIDDKIIFKALKNKKSVTYISNKFIDEMHFISNKFKLLNPTFEPKATVFVKSIIKLIDFLKICGFAYVSSNKDVYYKVICNSKYGSLSKSIINNNLFLAKSHSTGKYFNFDFALWKHEVGFWSTPWGCGRPGWHSECAAINLYYFKNKVDIHSGGKDLIFPHHENELAQILPVKNINFIKIWLHIAHVNVDNKKMSKSLFNHVLLKDLLKEYNEEYLRFFLLLTNYNKKINYSVLELKKSVKALDKLYKALLDMTPVKAVNKYYKNSFFSALNNNFNTVKAISVLFKALKRSGNNRKLLFTIKYLGNILGILKYKPKLFLKNKLKYNKFIVQLINKRCIARKMKNWILADNIRIKLARLGVYITDTKI